MFRSSNGTKKKSNADTGMCFRLQSLARLCGRMRLTGRHHDSNCLVARKATFAGEVSCLARHFGVDGFSFFLAGHVRGPKRRPTPYLYSERRLISRREPWPLSFPYLAINSRTCGMEGRIYCEVADLVFFIAGHSVAVTEIVLTLIVRHRLAPGCPESENRDAKRRFRVLAEAGKASTSRALVLWRGWLIVLEGVLGGIAFISAFKFTFVANVTIIYATAPFVAALLGWVLMR